MSEDKKSSTFIRKHIDKSSLSFNQNVINYDEKIQDSKHIFSRNIMFFSLVEKWGMIPN